MHTKIRINYYPPPILIYFNYLTKKTDGVQIVLRCTPSVGYIIRRHYAGGEVTACRVRER